MDATHGKNDGRHGVGLGVSSPPCGLGSGSGVVQATVQGRECSDEVSVGVSGGVGLGTAGGAIAIAAGTVDGVAIHGVVAAVGKFVRRVADGVAPPGRGLGVPLVAIWLVA